MTAMTNPLLNILIYGPPKSRKTWWAANAAAHGFNTILLSLDPDGWIVLNNPAFSSDLRQHITVLDISDTPTIPRASLFMSAFLKFRTFWYVPSLSQVYLNTMSLPDGIGFWQINPSLLSSNDMVICDSLSSLAYSSMFSYALNNKIDLADALKQEWEGYAWQGRLLSWMVTTFVALPCHKIMTAHATAYEKRKTITNSSTGRREQVVEWTRIIPQSSSGPHGLGIAREFNEVLYTSLFGENTYISTAPAPDRDGGSRVIAPGNIQWDNLQPSHLANAYGIPPIQNTTPSAAFVWFDDKTKMTNTSNMEQPQNEPVKTLIPQNAPIFTRPAKTAIRPMLFPSFNVKTQKGT